jgi:hypothetical protein
MLGILSPISAVYNAISGALEISQGTGIGLLHKHPSRLSVPTRPAGGRVGGPHQILRPQDPRLSTGPKHLGHQDPPLLCGVLPG